MNKLKFMKYFKIIYLLFSILVISVVTVVNTRWHMNMRLEHYLFSPNYSYGKSIFDIKKEKKLQREVNKSIQTSFKWTGVEAVFYFTDLGELLYKKKYDSGFKPDSNFILTEDKIKNLLANNSLSMSSYGILADAESDKHLHSLILLAKQKQLDLKNIIYTLNNYGNFTELKVVTFIMHTIFDFATYIAIIFLIIGYFIMRRILLYLEHKLAKAKEKLEEFKKQRAEDKVREIAEEESIRASVKKSIDSSDNEELEDLQNLINKAVAKGDSETAQALLKILNSKKDKDS